MKTLLLSLLVLLPTSSLVAETLHLQRADGTVITYYMDRPQEESYPLVVILQGSECLRVSDKYQPYLEYLVKRGAGVLRVEKPGLHARVEVGDCPDEYLRLNTPQQRVLDLLAVLGQLRRQEESWDGQLGLVGGSEGAMVAAMAAPLIPETKSVALLSGGGGLTFFDEVLLGIEAQWRASDHPPENLEQQLEKLRAQMLEAQDNPRFDKEWGSDGDLARNTHFWLAHIMPLKVSLPLLQLDCPILSLQGNQDLGLPRESFDLLVKAFQEAEKDNLESRFFEGGHVPPEDEILRALDWVLEHLPPDSN